MIGALLLLAQVVAPAAVPVAVPSLTVEDVWNFPERYDKQRVRVTGWLLECSRKRCMIHASNDVDGTHRISIARSPAFDRMAKRLLPRWITIEGIVNERCFRSMYVESETSSYTMGLCGERPGQLSDVVIVDFNPSTPPPAESEGS